MKSKFKEFSLKEAVLHGFVAGALFMITVPQIASAALINAQFSGNECAGQGGFSECWIKDENGGPISPVIAKFGGDLSLSEVSTKFPSVDGSEWILTPDVGFETDNEKGTWTYTQGTDDPDVRFWVVSAGNVSNVFWNVLDGNEGLCSAGNEFSKACMDVAIATTLGAWETIQNPPKPNGNPGSNKELSHITFFDTAGIPTPDPDPDPDPDPSRVPVPAAVWLFGSGLIGMLGFSRRKQNSILKA